MILLKLAIEFFKVGLFSFGGGYATIPFLYSIAERCSWFSIEELKQMIALSSVTPGPVGINMATYAGLKTASYIGAIVSTVFEVLPSFLIIILVAKILKKYKENFYVKSVLETLKPICCALLLATLIGLIKNTNFTLNSFMIMAILLFMSVFIKKGAGFYLLLGAISGLFLLF